MSKMTIYKYILNYFGLNVDFTLPMEVIEDENLIGAINGTMVGGAVLVECKKGLALYINGVDQVVDSGY